MEYIVLDLEWNSAYYKPQGRFINEIIQIGAVKLNDTFDIVDTFQVYIKSQLVKKLSGRTVSLTGITNETMNKGTDFRTAVALYNKWAGNDAITITWSDSDLYAMVENSRVFLDNSLKFSLNKYLDLQSYIQSELKLMGHTIINQVSLANAAIMLGISTDGFELHNAKDDSLLCGLMLKMAYNNERFVKFIQDTEDPNFYEKLFFHSYYISNINDARVNKANLKFTCSRCKKRLIRLNKWKYKNNWHRSEFKCENCNKRYRCMISFKQTYDKVITKKRVLEQSSNSEGKCVKVQKLPEKL